MAYLSDDELLDTEGGFTGWDDGTGTGAEETLEQALAEERLAELENELEQDEHAGGRGAASAPVQALPEGIPGQPVQRRLLQPKVQEPV